MRASSSSMPTSGRGPGRPSLPEEQIVKVATAIIDEDGADALTLRSLAARLGSSTATLYRHFDSRSSVLDAVVDAVFSEVDLSTDAPGPRDWSGALTTMAMSLFEALVRHPNVAPLMLDRIRTTSNVSRIREEVLGLLLANGFSPRESVQVYATVGRYVLGFGVQTRIDGRADPAVPDAAAQDITTLPATAAAAAAGAITLGEEFAFGLAMIVLGVQSTLNDHSEPKRPRLDAEPAPSI